MLISNRALMAARETNSDQTKTYAARVGAHEQYRHR